MIKHKIPKLTSVEEIARQVASGDMLVFGYVHAGFEPLFEALAEFNLDRDVKFFILSTLRYQL